MYFSANNVQLQAYVAMLALKNTDSSSVTTVASFPPSASQSVRPVALLCLVVISRRHFSVLPYWK